MLTSKNFDYLCWNAPILSVGGSAESEVGELLNATHRGKHFGKSQEETQNFLEGLVFYPRTRCLFGNERVREFSRNFQAEKFLQLLVELLHLSPSGSV